MWDDSGGLGAEDMEPSWVDPQSKQTQESSACELAIEC
jgi:hypothetical protein